jgi:hypothetical protein
MADQPGEAKKFGMHPPSHTIDLIGGQYVPTRNAMLRQLLGFQGYICTILSQIFVEILQDLRGENKQEDKHEPN